MFFNYGCQMEIVRRSTFGARRSTFRGAKGVEVLLGAFFPETTRRYAEPLTRSVIPRIENDNDDEDEDDGYKEARRDALLTRRGKRDDFAVER
jgi:hypothetical protein